MDETDLFGVQNPDTDELGFVSVMGAVEEHFAATVYLGAEGLYAFLNFQESLFADGTAILRMPQLMASFEDRNDLDKTDRDTIKCLGLKFRGRHAWPLFRHFHPGLVPWPISSPHARFLATALEQLLEIAPRVKDDPGILTHRDPEAYLVRVQSATDPPAWEDRVMPVLPPEPHIITVDLDPSLIEAVKQLPRAQTVVEIDCFLLLSRIGEPGQRPCYPYVVMLVDAMEEFILGFEMLTPLPSEDAVWAKAPDATVRQLASTGIRPSNIAVCSPLLAEILEPVASLLDIQLDLFGALPTLEDAREGLEAFMQRGGRGLSLVPCSDPSACATFAASSPGSAMAQP